METDSSSLYSLARRLLTYGLDGSPIYADQFTRLNSEVYGQALRLYNIRRCGTPEEEAGLCLSLLVAFNATIYDNGHKQQYIQEILDRSWEVLPRLAPSLLKVRLLTCCYGEVYEEELAQEAHAIIDSWQGRELSEEEREVMDDLRNLEENPYPSWSEVEGE
jgi:hypothetical protein